MRVFAFLTFFLTSFAAYAESYMVYQYAPNARVVLSQGSCLVKGLEGNRAAVQRDDGKYIRGCWKFVDDDQHVRIDWENPAKKGDFAILRVKDFTPVVE